jgi:hypothetical protein
MEPIQRLIPKVSPLVALAQHGAEAVGQIIAQSHQRVTSRASPPLEIDLKIEQNMPEVKNHMWPMATDDWLRMTHTDG